MDRQFQPILDKRGEPHVQRWSEQRWLIDNIIRANGIDWDQPRSIYLSAPCGGEANADFAAIRQRVQKMADIGPAFEAVARRREAKAKAALEAEQMATARDNYFMAAVHWGAAQWPYDQNDETNIAYNQKKRECYGKYAELADHRYVMVLHDHQANPHVHISVRAESRHGKRLNPRKADLQRWRETFAEKLRGWGIDAEATWQRTRGQTRNYEPIWRVKAHAEGRLRTPVRTARSGKGFEMDQVIAAEAWSKIAEGLSRSDHPHDRALAVHVERFLAGTALAVAPRRDPDRGKQRPGPREFASWRSRQPAKSRPPGGRTGYLPAKWKTSQESHAVTAAVAA